MDFVVGDATCLKDALFGNQSQQSRHQKSARNYSPDLPIEKGSTSIKLYDAIIDKGLMDALMCGESFDTIEKGFWRSK